MVTRAVQRTTRSADLSRQVVEVLDATPETAESLRFRFQFGAKSGQSVCRLAPIPLNSTYGHEMVPTCPSASNYGTGSTFPIVFHSAVVAFYEPTTAWDEIESRIVGLCAWDGYDGGQGLGTEGGAFIDQLLVALRRGGIGAMMLRTMRRSSATGAPTATARRATGASAAARASPSAAAPPRTRLAATCSAALR